MKNIQIKGMISPNKDRVFHTRVQNKYRTNEMSKTKKIAIVKQGGLGDYVMFTAFIKNLRKVEPDSHLTLFTGSNCLAMWQLNPRINRVIPIISGEPLYASECINIDELLKPISHINEFFDTIYDPNHCIDYYFNGLICNHLKSNNKIAYKKDKSIYKNFQANDFYNKLLDRPYFKNVAYYNSNFLEKIYGNLILNPFETELFTSIEDEAIPIQKGSNIIAIHASGSIAFRTLSKNNVLKIISLIFDAGCTPLVIGQDQWGISHEIPIFINELKLTEIFYLVSCSKGIICVDSGLKHVAGHYKIPTIEISHIPKNLNNLNGPYATDTHPFTGVEYWQPNPDSYFHEIIHPLGNFLPEDIRSGKSLNSINMSHLKDALQRLLLL